MKLTINNTALLKELKKISSVISRNTILPILENVLINVNKKEVTITGTNLNTTVVTKLECDSEEVFDFLFPFQYLVDICSASASPLKFTVSDKNIVIKNDKTSFKNDFVSDPNNFSKIEDRDYLFTVDVAGDFFFALSNADKFRSKDQMNTRLNTVCIDFGKSSTSVVATDGMCLYKSDFDVKVKTPTKARVSSAFISIVKGFQDSTISVDEKFVRVESGNTTVIDTQSEGVFVDYTVLLRGERNYNVTFDNSELKSAISASEIAANLMTKEVLFTFGKKNVELQSSYEDVGKGSVTSIKADHSVEIDSVKFNGVTLSSLLGTITSQKVKMSITTHKAPVYIQPEEDETVLLMIAPLVL